MLEISKKFIVISKICGLMGTAAMEMCMVFVSVFA